MSLGNILVVDGKGQLVDLEFAQTIGTGGRQGIRTVRQHARRFPTTYLSYPHLIYHSKIAFTAVEVALGSYHFTTHSQAALDRLLGKRQPALFVHNPLHGVEFLWLGTSLGSVMRYTLDDLG